MIGRWHGPGGYREILTIGLPMMVSMGSITLMQFTDRLFLSHYSLEAIAAVLPAGITSFLFFCFFMGTAGYVSVFIAQYIGAARPERVGAALWQGIWFALFAGGVLAALSFSGDFLFSAFGHEPAIRELEVAYFRISMLGGGFVALETTLACLYTGQGLTRTVMVANITAAMVNIPLDYMLINGVWIFPELGIRGAALATVAAWAVINVIYLSLVFARRNEERFRTRSAWRIEPDLFKRFLRYGLPGGVQFFLDIFAITFFVLMVGRLGTVELASTNMAFNLDTLAFMPVVGLSIALSTITGQSLGRGEPDLAARATINTIHLALLWMGAISLVFFLFPAELLGIYRTNSMSEAEFAPIVRTGTMLLRFVVVYSLLDAVAITLFGTLKGAGDSLYLMLAMGSACLTIMVAPVYVAVNYLDPALFFAWVFLTCYILTLALLMILRYRQGKWRGMRVIEAPAAEAR